MASCTLEETLQRLNVSACTTFPASLFQSKTSGQLLYLEAGKDFVDALQFPASASRHHHPQHTLTVDLQVAKEHLMRPRPAAIGCSCRAINLPVLSALEKAKHTFIVTDSLEIMPLTTIKSVYVLSKLNVNSLADLEGNDITVSLTQTLQLLHSALTSNNCLNEVFGKSK